MNPSTQSGPVEVAAFYRFTAIADPAATCRRLKTLCKASGLSGTILVAREGVNGTVAGSGGALEGLFTHLRDGEGIEGLSIKLSEASTPPFHRMKVRLKREIVTMGVDDLDPATCAGTHVAPRDWNALIADPETIVIDTRNAYETAIGTFEGAVDPQTASFRDFPAWIEGRRAMLSGRKVAMFCTGGIRCEKATAYARSLGLEEVYHLDGGILKYLEEIPAGDSLWRGECFVFDERVSVRHGLEEGEAELCRACRRPLTPEERQSPLFVEGSSCPHCHDARSDADRDRYAERHRQVTLAAALGKRHIGG